MNFYIKYYVEYLKLQGNLLIYNCVKCWIYCNFKFDDKLQNTFVNIFTLSRDDLNKFVFPLPKELMQGNIWNIGQNLDKRL